MQALRNDQVVGRVGEHREAVTRELVRCVDGRERVGLQRVVVADHFELDPRGAENLARHLRQRDRLLCAVAAGGVGQDPAAERADALPKAVAAAVLGLQAAQAHRQHLRAACAHRVGQALQRWVLGGAEHQAATQVGAGDAPGFVGHGL